MNIIRLGSINTDKATGLTGTVTHLHVGLDHQCLYGFQPRGLNPETGQPVSAHWVPSARLEHADELCQVELPLKVLGTAVRDMASGFAGTAVSIELHISGCLHVNVQPAGTEPKTGSAFRECNFDIRRLEGPALKKLTAEEVEEDKRAKPSPTPIGSPMPRRPL